MASPQHLLLLGVFAILIGLGHSQIPDEWLPEPHPCERQCVQGAPPMTCEYEFEIEWYVTLSKACYECPFNLTDCYRPECVSGDGQRRKLITVNKQFPGPKIEVCENDTVVVHVINELGNGEGTIIHWHGMEMRGTNHMDGAGRLTQCPIPQFNEFTYEFVAYPSGTFVYHAHYGKQRADGLAGPLVVREPAEDNPHWELYDHNCDTPTGDCEIMNFLTEWMEPDFVLMNYRIFHYSAFERAGRNTALMNGRMQYYEATNVLRPGETALTPYEVFRVQQGKNYLVRMYGFSVECLYEISVESHKMLITAADGYYVDPVEIDILSFAPGERYDYILRADQPIGNYWVKITSGLCSPSYAIVHYEGAPEGPPETDPTEIRTGLVLNPTYPTVPQEDRTYMMAVELNSTRDENWSEETVDEVHFIGMEMMNNDRDKYYDPVYYPRDDINPAFTFIGPLFNNISFLEPKSPLLTQYDDLDPATLCNVSTIDNDACYENRCYCTNLEQIALGSTVDLVYVNMGDFEFGHPMHLHGFHYRVVAQMAFDESTPMHIVKDMYENGEIPLKLDSPTYRDTVIVPAPGVMIARFQADNPGFWLMHCHVDVHADVGQMMAFQVGTVEQMTPPPADMPTCGDWAPSTGFNNRKVNKPTWTKNKDQKQNEKVEKENEKMSLKKLFAADNKV